ncbi:hypothetical protein ACFQVA_39570 [Actinomadura keratinilytica]
MSPGPPPLHRAARGPGPDGWPLRAFATVPGTTTADLRRLLLVANRALIAARDEGGGRSTTPK